MIKDMMKRLVYAAAALCLAFPAMAGTPDSMPRPEYPRPQFVREDWVNLNGTWSYEFDFSRSGMDRRLFESEGFEGSITVPFAPQSELSGVGFKDFIPEMWYHRILSVPDGWAGKRIILHFGAVVERDLVVVGGFGIAGKAKSHAFVPIIHLVFPFFYVGKFTEHFFYKAVLIGFLRGHILNGQHAAAAHFAASANQLTQSRLLGVNQVIGQNHAERFVAHHRSGAEYSMSQTERFGLTNEDEIDATRRHGMHQIQKFVLALGREIGFQFRALVEVIFNGTLVAARDKDHVGNAGSSSFFHGILDERLIDYRQHFLGHCLSGGQEAGAQTGNREYSLTNGFHVTSQMKRRFLPVRTSSQKQSQERALTIKRRS